MIPHTLRRRTLAAAALAAVCLLGWGVYALVDPYYPQELWRFFRPERWDPVGQILYRTDEGQLFLASAHSLSRPRQLAGASLGSPQPARAAADGPAPPREIIRDATVLPDRQHVAYFASHVQEGRRASDHLNILSLSSGAVVLQIELPGPQVAPPTVYASRTGRFLAVTDSSQNQFSYWDANTGQQVDQPGEALQVERNPVVGPPLAGGQPAQALSPHGKLRAELRTGQRRAPLCPDAKCEVARELTVLGQGSGPIVLFGAFPTISSDGWAFLPGYAGQRFVGRLVWAPDSRQLLFTTLDVDGGIPRVYAVAADGRTRPRQVLERAEALDWID